MGSKRRRESAEGSSEKRRNSKKRSEGSKKDGSSSQPKTASKPNYESQQNDVILVESSDNEDLSDGIVVESDHEEAAEAAAKSAKKKAKKSSKPPKKKQKLADSGNEVAGNNDFIGFGFSSSENEDSGSESETHVEKTTKKGEKGGPKNAHGDGSSAFPWVKGQNHSTQKEIADWLTLEIKDFVNYISPSKDEIVVRNAVIGTLKREIAQFWPQTQAHVFGSCATDLYLPGSDIDMVVVSTTGDYEQRQRLYQLSSFLRTHKLAKNIEVIASAKVPIIKFVDPKHNIHVDISFERTNGLDAARRIRRWLDTTPGLRELVLIIKQFLRSRMLNNVHVGGLGGYATIILVYHFMKLHPRIATGNLVPSENLGTLLIEFFELYGRNFSYDNLIIALDVKTEAPKYLLKYMYPSLATGRGQFTLVVQDPSDPNNNITRASYNLRDLRKAFGGAYQLLVAKCYELHSAPYKQRLGRSILGDIIKYKGKDRDFNDDRDKVVNSALINHADEEDVDNYDVYDLDNFEDDGESDGADGNDKYYLSDMTGESDVDTSVTEKKGKEGLVLQSGKLDISFAPVNSEAKSKKKKKDSVGETKKVADFMSIEVHSEDEDDKKTPTASLDKEVKRDYWSSKGLEAA